MTEKLKPEDLRVGSLLEDMNGERHTVIGFYKIFVITTYGKGENWLLPFNLSTERLVKY